MTLADVDRALRQHREGMDEQGLVLNAGTNAIPPARAAHHDVQLGMRPSMGPAGAKAQTGMEHVEELEAFTTRAVAAAVRADHADVRVMSGTLANLAVYCAVLDVGATLAALPARAGGHVSHHAAGVAGLRALRVAELPFDPPSQDVDLDALPAFLRRERPGLVVVGGSFPMFPHALRPLAEAVHGAGALLLYDASHTAGLVAGGCFQDPLADGADVVTFSTYKSFGGPAGGAIATTNAALAARIDRVVYPALTANYDAGRLPVLAVAACALLDAGAAYAQACIGAAQRLARELAARGHAPLHEALGFTASHLLAVPVSDAPAAADRLAQAGIFVSPVQMATADGDRWALRLGTQELVRRGCGEAAMPAVADLLDRGLRGRDDPARLGRAVAEFRGRL